MLIKCLRNPGRKGGGECFVLEIHTGGDSRILVLQEIQFGGGGRGGGGVVRKGAHLSGVCGFFL